MVSRTSLTCNHYAAGCTKTSTKILHQKNSKKEENAPDSARKRRNRVRFGCWRGWQRLGTDKTRCEKPKFEPKRTPFPCTTCKKKPGRNTVFPPGLWQGQKDLNPRHAVLEWMWKQRTESGGGTRLRRSTSQVTKRAVLVWCCEEISGPKGRENPGKAGNTLTRIDKDRIIKVPGLLPAGRLLQTGG